MILFIENSKIIRMSSFVARKRSCVLQSLNKEAKLLFLISDRKETQEQQCVKKNLLKCKNKKIKYD